MRNIGSVDRGPGEARGAFGDYLRQLRGDRTLAAVAVDAGMSLYSYRLIETGGRSSLGVGELSRIARALGTPPSDLIGKAREAGY